MARLLIDNKVAFAEIRAEMKDRMCVNIALEGEEYHFGINRTCLGINHKKLSISDSPPSFWLPSAVSDTLLCTCLYLPHYFDIQDRLSEE